MVTRSKDLSLQKAGLLARFSFSQGLFELQTSQSGKQQWTVTLLFPKSANLAPLHEIALEAATAKWGAKAADMIANGIIKTPFLDGDGKQGRSMKTGEARPGYPGSVFIRCSSGADYRPVVVDNKLAPITDKSALYSGCYGYAVVHAYAWEHPQNGRGISFGISFAMKVKDGENLGGSIGKPEDYLEAVPDEGEAPPETQGGSGAAALFGNVLG